MRFTRERLEDKPCSCTFNLNQSNTGSGVDTAGNSCHPEPWVTMLYAVFNLPESLLLVWPTGCNRLIALFHQSIHKQCAVEPPAFPVDRKKHKTGGFTVDTVQRHQVINAVVASQRLQRPCMRADSGG